MTDGEKREKAASDEGKFDCKRAVARHPGCDT